MDPGNWKGGTLRSSYPPAKPFLKWAGGKGQLIDRLRKYIPLPAEGSTYFEPFLGAGAVFFALLPARAFLSDINRPLMETYEVVRTRPSELIRLLSELATRPDSDEYYARRKEFNELIPSISLLGPQERIRLAALFIWLNHTCYNGLFRVNRSGLFNVPFGSAAEPSIFEPTNIKSVSKALNRGSVKLRALDFKEALLKARSDDVVYLDPPYDPGGSAGGFTEYTASGFDRIDQTALADVVRDLVDRGCKVVLSNSSTPAVDGLYKGFERHTVTARRAISCIGDRRGKVKETLVIG